MNKLRMYCVFDEKHVSYSVPSKLKIKDINTDRGSFLCVGKKRRKKYSSHLMSDVIWLPRIYVSRRVNIRPHINIAFCLLNVLQGHQIIVRNDFTPLHFLYHSIIKMENVEFHHFFLHVPIFLAVYRFSKKCWNASRGRFHILSAETMGPGVDFENPDICASKESSVVFKCSYNYSDKETVRETGWQKGELRDNKWERVKLSDLPSYQNRWKYIGDHQHNCNLALHDLQDNDTGYYYFWFDTNRFTRYSKGSVYLSVTGKMILHHNITLWIQCFQLSNECHLWFWLTDVQNWMPVWTQREWKLKAMWPLSAG